MERAVSTAPPPGTTRLDSNTRFTTQRASCSDRSISSTMKSLAPRKIMEAALRAPRLGERRGRGGGSSKSREDRRREEGKGVEEEEAEEEKGESVERIHNFL